eukprot:TRINITY_DN1402_c0_g1_i1.p1 TRINITY_DN1402_c0_g1~~TRINITY_DN1402_c0_g1_i1.p1  ORF type:complete len:446 (+),score=230.75 TRINITY_DN1402_c0_g1_i1:48-1385(+)
MSGIAKIGLFPLLIVVFFALYVAAFAIFIRYDEKPDIAIGSGELAQDPRVQKYYKVFIDVSIMVFVGFGFLMTFTKHYSWSSVSLNFLVSVFVVPWALLLLGFFESMGESAEEEKPFGILLTFPAAIDGLFCVASVLIAFGAVLGKTTPLQLLVMGLFQTVFYSILWYVIFYKFEAFDVGGSIGIHAFGAYFGVFCSLIFSSESAKNSDKETASKTSDLFAMIGTIFLWIFWPSFNGALAPAADQMRCVINTYLSLVGSGIAAFLISYVLRGGKFEMCDIQNATIAGGVAVGSASDLFIQPAGALLVGFVGGTISVVGYRFIQPALKHHIGLHDTCGVHNLHGMPGVWSGIVTIIATGLFGVSNASVTPSSSFSQAFTQILSLAAALIMAAVGGVITGFVLRLLPYQDEPFEDNEFWNHHEEGAHEEQAEATATVDDKERNRLFA